MNLWTARSLSVAVLQQLIQYLVILTAAKAEKMGARTKPVTRLACPPTTILPLWILDPHPRPIPRRILTRRYKLL